MVYSVSGWISKRRWWALWEVGGTADVGGARRLSGFCLLLAPKRRPSELSFTPSSCPPPPASLAALRWCVVAARVSARGPVPAFPGSSQPGGKAKAESNKSNQGAQRPGQPVPWCPPPLSPALGLRRPGRPGCPPVPWKIWGKRGQRPMKKVGMPHFVFPACAASDMENEGKPSCQCLRSPFHSIWFPCFG